ncbi:MAG: tetratricopeptide repeat-containing sensor histidine kinase, partial [Tannerellaceae bacterium]|jgi:signal transduction histidine kinase|nr:tetratricopeptide repeat-containing sensor histidine kinase [Tannerellaceae bacterium]
LLTRPLSDTDKIEVYNTLSDEYLSSNIERAAELAQAGLQLALEHNEWFSAGYFYSYLGLSHYYSSRYDSSMVYFEKMLSVAKQMKEENIEKASEVEADAYTYIGIANDARGKLKEAVEYYLVSLDIAEKNKLDKLKNLVLVNLGRAYYCLKNYDKALAYYEKAIALRKILGDDRYLVYDYTGMVAIYREKQEYDKALEYAGMAYDIIEHDPKVTLESKIFLFQEWAECLIKSEKDYGKALENTQKALRYAEEWNSSVHIANSLRQMAFVYLKQGKYALSEQTALRALATDSADLYANSLLYEYIGKANMMMGNTEKAIAAFDRQNSLNIAYSNKNYQSALSEMEVKYETEKKELQIAEQEAVIARHKTVRAALTGGLALAAVILLLLWYVLHLRSRRNRALAEMNATKDKFFSIISHDLKGPAISQRNALQELIQNPGWDDNTLRNYYTQLLKSADSEVELIYNLLNWAQTQTGRMPFRPAPFDFASELRRTEIKLLQNMADQKGVTLYIAIPKSVIVTGDSNMLSTVIRNLMTNALKFTPAGGMIGLEIEPLMPPPKQKGRKKAPRYCVEVCDTGVGMTEEQLRNLFRLDTSQTQRGTAGEQGSGLGLIVCQELLKTHGATLHVESQESQGSRFWFQL